MIAEWKKYPASLDFYEEMRDELAAVFDAAQLPEDVRMKTEIGFEEAVVNIINYAYEDDGDIRIKISFDDEFFNIELVDHGQPFNPLEHNDARAEDDSPIDMREPGGFGIFLLKKTFDKLNYSRENFNGKPANHLTLSLRRID